MIMRGGLLALSLIFCSTAASAATSGDNTVVIAVNDVQTPDKLPGDCVAKGVIKQVLAGAQFHVGQSIAIKVACGDRTAILDNRPATGGPTSVDAMVLAKSKLGAVRLDDTGAVIWHAPAIFPPAKYAQYGAIVGYRVLDGVVLPLRRELIS